MVDHFREDLAPAHFIELIASLGRFGQLGIVLMEENIHLLLHVEHGDGVSIDFAEDRVLKSDFLIVCVGEQKGIGREKRESKESK